MPEDREMAEVVSLEEENGGETRQDSRLGLLEVEKVQNRMETSKRIKFLG